MLDGFMRRRIDPTLDRAGRAIAAKGIGADALTLAGLFSGLAAAAAIAGGAELSALALFGLNRLLDGLDGAVARASRRSDRGGLLDIVCDFTVYGAVPLGFALRDPLVALPAAVLLFSFYVNGATFLAYAALAARRGLAQAAHPAKSLYFRSGLAEGTETILVFAAMLVVPAWFPALAYGFAAWTLLGAVLRMAFAWTAFADQARTGG